MTADELKYVLAVALIERGFFGRRKIVLTLNHLNSLKDHNPTGREDIIIISKKELSEKEKQMVREMVRKDLDANVSEGEMTEEDRARNMVIVHVVRKFEGWLTKDVFAYGRDTVPNPDAITDHRKI